MVTAITGSAFLSEGVLFMRDILRVGIIDPMGKNGSEFVYTSYPKENVKYPIVTVKNRAFRDLRRGGMQSESTIMNLIYEVRVWATNEKHRDEISQSVYNYLKNSQIGGGSTTIGVGLHDFSLISVADVDEEGEQGVKSRVMEYKYLYINEDT